MFHTKIIKKNDRKLIKTDADKSYEIEKVISLDKITKSDYKTYFIVTRIIPRYIFKE